MQEVFSKIIEKLNSKKVYFQRFYECEGKSEHDADLNKSTQLAFDDAIEIVKQEAEKFGTDTNVGSNGWIPVSERLPDEAFGCLVTVMDCNPSTQTEFENILPYFVGYDGETWNDADGEEIPFEVIAWQPLPEPYQPKGELEV